MWSLRFLKSSIGKKWLMACTGGCLLLFLFSHAAGNATIFNSLELFQSYANNLHSHPLIVAIFSRGLLLIFIIHIVTGVLLFLQNKKARPQGYKIQTRAIQNSQASSTMLYSGLLILLFVLIHTAAVSFGDHATVGVRVARMFGSFPVSIFYIISFMVLAAHLSHGIWSMLQTFGINHPRYTALIMGMSYIIPIAFFLIFGSIPLLFLFAQ